MKRDPEPDVRYAVGLDIGDGESALCWLRTNDRETADVFVRAPDGRSVVTATALERGTGPGGANRRVIGEAAVLVKDGVQFSVNFKSPPDPLGLDTPEAVLFAQVLLTEFFAAHPEVRDDCTVYVGHPTGWEPEVVAPYGEHLASLRVPVRLMPESQSALVHVRDRRAERRGGQGLSQVLVVDVGSSTTDVTFVDDLRPRNLAVGSALGCREIEETLVGRALEELKNDGAFCRAVAESGGTDILRLLCRRMKEAQFTGEPEKFLNVFSSCDPQYTAIVSTGLPWLRGVEIPRQVVEAPGGWADRFRALLEEVREHLAAQRPELVVLTGGGSRMPVVRDISRSVFPEAVVENDNDPALTVARGLASVGRHRVAMDRFREDIAALQDLPAFKKAIHGALLSAFSRVRSNLRDRLVKQDGGAAESDQEIDDLIHEIARMDKVLDDLHVSIVAALTPLVLGICSSYGIRDDQFPMVFEVPDLVGTSMQDRIRGIWQQISAAQAVHSTVTSLAGTAVLAARGLLRNSSHPVQFVAGTAAVVAAVGGAKGAQLLARRRLEKTLETAELDHDETVRLVGQVAQAVTVQMDARALEVERYLF
ncbi:hypothetical protein A6A06_12530 [Streptomyces sp. CB02923]|uniref:Hsp70 family protein n=1 Tax=Streptomyces sp. CB02923 TaxID=1718985 RepID=UPI00093BFD7C|nr:hypothetical protein [Streptomyces sp. CB02923]OKI01944.1 hypothetical protein A6A06_12530 [Streptomyces sp. CB02923]